MVLGLRMRGCLQRRRCGVHFRGVHSARGLRAIAALPRTCILIAACRGAVSSREGKEPRTTPGGAGDGAGDGGQARVGRPLAKTYDVPPSLVGALRGRAKYGG